MGPEAGGEGSRLDAVEVSAWFGDTQVLDDVSLSVPPASVTALIGPSGCGKSTFLRILNRMHESVLGAKMAGEVRLDGDDIYAPGHRLTDVRRHIGMVFQKPNPFPAMSIADNVAAGLALNSTKISKSARAELVEALPHPSRPVAGGEGPALSSRRRTLGWTAAATLYRPGPGGAAEGAVDGRAVFGLGPDIDPRH